MSDNEKRLVKSWMGFSNGKSILLERCRRLRRDFDSAISYGDIVDDGMDTTAELLSRFIEDVFLLENEE